MDKEVIMLKLYNGDYVIGEMDNTAIKETGSVRLENPRVFVFMPTMGGTMKAGFQPVCFFNKECKKSMSFSTAQIMLTVPNSDIPKEIENGYKTEITGISIANPSDVAAVNGSKNVGGEFVI